MNKIGILGYGTIGKHIFEQLKIVDNIEVSFICDPFTDVSKEIADIHITTLNENAVKSVDLIVEVATSEVVLQYYEMILRHTNFMAFSGTALADKTCEDNIHRITKENNTTFYIPHGAVLGLDGIFDGRTLLESVEIVTTKKPKGFSVEYSEKTLLYKGPTRGACTAYPRNVNVHAAIALAGLGMDKTYSKIIADPDISANTHTINIKGEGINFSITIESTPLGKVTGKYTPCSALGSILRVFNEDQEIQIV